MANVWNGASGPGALWSNAANWSTGLPQPSDDVSIPSGSVLLNTTTGSTTITSATIANNASLAIKVPGSTVTVTGNFTDNGGVGIDNTAFDSGGSTLAIGGILTVTNSGAGLAIGNYLQGSDATPTGGTPSTTLVTAASVTNTGTITIQSYDVLHSQAILRVASVAGFGGQAGVLTGNVNIGSDGLHAGSTGLLEFASGQINTIASGGRLFIYGAHSYLAHTGATNSNSALTGLSTINGSLVLQAGAAVSTGALTVAAGGSVATDTAFLGTAGSSLTVGGQLTVAGQLSIGRSAMTGDALVTTNSLSATGTISLNGDIGTNSNGRLVVNSVAGLGTAGVVTANINMGGQSVLQFADGQITTIAAGRTVAFDGANAFIADAGSITSNSALTGLSNINGSLILQGGTSISTAGALTIAAGGNTAIDTAFLGTAGSTIAVGGQLTVNGQLSIGRSAMTGDAVVNAASLGGIGAISIDGQVGGGPTPSYFGKLIVNSAAGSGVAGVLTVDLDIKGKSLLQFASGQIATIANGANVIIRGTNAFIADAGSTSSNSALTGLSAVEGGLILIEGASVSTDSGLTIGNGINGANVQINTGGSLAANGVLTLRNGGNLTVGGGGDAVPTNVTATGLANAGGITIGGNTANGGINHGNLVINGAGSNTGTINVNVGTLHVTGALTGGGTITLTNGALVELGSSASGGAVIFGAGSTTLKLGNAAAVTNAITGFAAGDVINLAGHAVVSLTYAGTTLTAGLQGGGADVLNLAGTFTGLAAVGDGGGGTNLSGLGGSFTLTGGLDVVLFNSGTNTLNGTAATLGANDNFMGGSGADTLSLTGGGLFAFGSRLTGFDQLTLDDNTYDVTTAGPHLPAGQTLVVNGAALSAGHTLSFLGSNDSTGVYAMTGGGGNDTLIGGSGNDVLNGGDGVDFLQGNGGNDTLNGGDGGDALHGLLGDDAINGELGDDVAIGFEGNDTLHGNDGNDTLIGDDSNAAPPGSDSLFGGAGVDQLFGYAGSDTLDGGADGDFLSGGDGDDAMTGGDGDDAIHGEGGNDTGAGGTGNDVLVGYEGNDTLSGDDGHDTIIGNAGDDTLNGGDGNDQIFGYEDVDAGNGGVGDDFLAGGAGNDTLHGDDGGDVLDGEADDDQLFGDDGGDNLNGNFGNDTLFGGAGNDGLLGWDGDDILDGGAGNDFLIGDRADGSGNRGNDTFVFHNGTGNDNVADLQAGIGVGDVIDIRDFGFANFAAVLAAATDLPNGIYIQLDADDAILIEGLAKAQLAADDFLLA